MVTLTPIKKNEAVKSFSLSAMQQQPGMGEDVGRSLLSGLRSGVETTLGAFGDVADINSRAASWLAGKAGVSPETAGMIGDATRFLNPGMAFAPKTSDIQEQVSTPAVGEHYQPETTAGEYAQTIGEFAPAALLPGGVGRKAAMAVVPALTSETAGQATEGTAMEPWARAAGALAGGVASAGRVNPVAAAAKGAPTREALKQTADDFYGQLRNAGIKYDSNAWGQTVQRMTDSLLKEGYRPSVAKDAFALVDDLTAQSSHALDFDDINGLVKMVGGKARDAARQGDNTSASAYGIIRDRLDEFERLAPLKTDKPMAAEELAGLRKGARTTALKNIKARVLDEIVQNADTYQSGTEAGIRNGIGNLLRSKKGQQLFTGEERTALLEVSQGRKALRTLSRFGFDLERLSGNATAIPALGAIGAGTMLEPMSGAALLAAGTAAKAASPRLTMRAMDKASAAIRSGDLKSSAGREATKRLRDEQTLRRLLAAPMASSQAR